VLPLEVAATPGDEWIRLGGMDVLAARLRGGGLQVPASDGVLALLADVDGAVADARLRRSHAGALIVRVNLVATSLGWRVDVSAKSADGLVLQTGSLGDEPLTALRHAGGRLLAQLERGLASDRAGTTGQPTLPDARTP